MPFQLTLVLGSIRLSEHNARQKESDKFQISENAKASLLSNVTEDISLIA
jgi:hypothetical protein